MAPSPPARWDPAQYARFERMRLRPALDLIERLPAIDARRVVDLGCGAGGPTRLLARRFPRAAVVGVDASAEMLREAAGRAEEVAMQEERPARPSRALPDGEECASAREACGARGAHGAPDVPIAWQRCDLAAWRASEPVDVLFSNAALHWLDGHAALFGRLARALAPGGVLAVQMPASHELASHRLLRETLAERAPDGRAFGSDALRARCARRPVAEMLDYRAMLAPWTRAADVWTYEYVQALEGDDPVLEWVRGSALVPVLAELEARPAPVREAFLERYRERLARAYPREHDGRTRFPFPRLFVLARAGGGAREA